MTSQIDSRTGSLDWLRRALQVNGLVSGLTGLGLIAGAQPLAAAMGLPGPAILFVVGAGLLPFALALLGYVAREPVDPRAVLTIAILDVAWVAGSVLILLGGWLPLTTAGKWGIAIVADVVAVFAALEFYGVRQLRARR